MRQRFDDRGSGESSLRPSDHLERLIGPVEPPFWQNEPKLIVRLSGLGFPVLRIAVAQHRIAAVQFPICLKIDGAQLPQPKW